MQNFAILFKKYRLRSEFETFSAFGDALSEKGYHYDESIFSHWQKGSRIPSNRQLLLTLITIFKERNSLSSLNEANDFLESVGLGYLTDEEKEKLDLEKIFSSPFQVPNEIANFTGREKLTKEVQKKLLTGKIVLLHGAPGIGKTALAITLGHQLKDRYPDGILWYKVDSSNSMDILLSIARIFGEDIHEIKDIEVRASIVRTLLAKKKVLLIFDNVTQDDKLNILLPNTKSCGVIFTSREKALSIATEYISFPLNLFTPNEVISLFEKVFTKKYASTYKKVILTLSAKVGNLPLAVNIAATHLKEYKLTPEEYIKRLNESVDLKSFTYEDKSLLQTVDIGFNSLSDPTKQLFISLGVFEGKDFSIEAVSYITKFSQNKAEIYIQQLLSLSFIERSKVGRYRIHPLLKIFARERIKDSTIYLRAAEYYEKQLVSAEEKRSYKNLTQETDNIIYIFKKCYDYGYWDQLITLWNPVENFLSDANEVRKLQSLMSTIDTTPRINKIQKFLVLFLILNLFYWIFLILLGTKDSYWGYLYSFLITIPSMLCGIGIFRSKFWGLFKTNIGKAIFFISAGSLSWGIGNIIWTYYNFIVHESLPYPSLADLGFGSAYSFWIAGIIFLAKATGTKFEIKQKPGKLFLLIIPLIIVSISYYFLLFGVNRSYRLETFLKTFLDLYYPSMDVIIITLATIIFGLSVNFFRGRYRLSIYAILFGFGFLYLADSTFSYTTAQNIYFNGNLADFLFTIAFSLLAWGTLSFYLTPKRALNVS